MTTGWRVSIVSNPRAYPYVTCIALFTPVYSSFDNLKPGLHFERKSTAYTQTILRTWAAFSRPPMPIYAVEIAQVPSIDTPTIRRLLRVDAGLSLARDLCVYAGFYAEYKINPSP